MNDLRSLSRVVLIGIIAYLLLPPILGLMFMIPDLISGNGMGPSYFFQYLIPILLKAIASIAILLLIICKSDWMVGLIIKENTGLDMKGLSPASVYRLSTVVMGGLYTYWAVFGIISIIGKLIDFRENFNTDSSWAKQHFIDIFGLMILFGLGCYMIAGAPHFVRWQIKKMQEELGEPKADSASSSGQF
jgi:hypothetical protein